jgi:hypothetical protein
VTLGFVRALTALAALACAAVVEARTAAQPIPQNPLDLQAVPAFVGAPAVPARLRSFHVPQHPFMAPNGRSNVHDDAYQTDNYLGPGPLGRTMQVQSNYQSAECGSLVFDSAGRIVTICVGLDRPRLFLFDPTNLDAIAQLDLPPREPRPGSTVFSDFCGGGYFYLDNLDHVVTSTNNRQIWVLGETAAAPDPGLEVLRTYDLSTFVVTGDCIVSALPDWRGLLWFVSANGVVGTIEPGSGAVQVVRLDGEVIANSFAVDRGSGVYIVSDHALYRFDADALHAPIVTWRQTYDRGSVQKPGQVSQGSGTTPTLIAGKYVAITDNADPQMHVLVYRRRARAGQPPAEVCAEPVFAAGTSDTENSLIAVGRSLIVENNYGYSNPSATEEGRTTTPGIARVDLDRPSGCHTAWTNLERAPSSVAKVSLANGLLYAYTKDPGPGTTDAWYFTAIDFLTGQTVYKQLAGTGLGYNNNYAPVTLDADGTAYIGSLGGLVQLRDAP